VGHDGDLGARVLPVLPDGLAPPADHRIALGTRHRGGNLDDTHRSMPFGYRRGNPRPPGACELRVGPLHLVAGKMHSQIEMGADEAKDDADRLAPRTGILRRVAPAAC